MQLRQDLGREDGWRNGFRQPRWQDSSHGRRQLVRHPGGRGAPGNEVAFLVTSGANFCGYGSGAEFAGGESFAQRPEGGPPQGAAASCPVSARVDTRGGPHTSPWERMPPQHALHVPPTWRAKDVGVDGVPREHLWGRSPFRCPVRGAERARRADRGEHTGGLPRFGPRWTRKTLLLLGCIELGSSGAWRASYTERMAVWIPNVRTPSTLHTGLLL